MTEDSAMGIAYPVLAGVKNWEQLNWDEIGDEYIQPAQMGRPLSQYEEQYLNKKGFHLIEQLGSGNFAQVWLVRIDKLERIDGQIENNINLACKFMQLRTFKKSFKKVKDSVNDLLREYKIMSDLSHQNIVKTEHVFHILDEVSNFPQPITLCHFMELCEGNLRYAIEESPNGVMDEIWTNLWFVQICDAVKYIHDKRIVHLDLKPLNVLYIGNEHNRKYKLTDFGLSIRFMGNRAMKSSFSVGTPSYMAPEVKSRRRFDTKMADIYSLGMTLAESLAGKGMQNSFVTKVRAGDTAHQYGRISEDVKDLILSMTSTVPSERPSIDAVLSHKWMVPFWQSSSKKQ